MASKTEIKARLTFWKSALEGLQNAYLALLEGGVKHYRLKDRELTRLDLPELEKEIEQAENKIDTLEAVLNGRGRRRLESVVPRGW